MYRLNEGYGMDGEYDMAQAAGAGHISFPVRTMTSEGSLYILMFPYTSVTIIFIALKNQ